MGKSKLGVGKAEEKKKVGGRWASVGCARDLGQRRIQGIYGVSVVETPTNGR